MNYDNLKIEAERTIRPLAAVVARCERELAFAHKRAKTERDNIEKLEVHLATLKSSAGRYLAEQNEYATFQTKIKRLTADLAAAQGAVEMFKSDLIPDAERALADAKKRVQCGLIDLVKAHLPACEKRMAERIAEVLRVRDEFMGAADFLFGEYADGVGFSGGQRLYPDGAALRTDPLRSHLQIATSLFEESYDPMDSMRRRNAYLVPTPEPTPPEAVKAAPVLMAKAPESVEPPQSGVPGAPKTAPEVATDARTPSLEESVKGEPAAAPCPAAAALDALDDEEADAAAMDAET